jgi:acetyl esterase/lipase
MPNDPFVRPPIAIPLPVLGLLPALALWSLPVRAQTAIVEAPAAPRAIEEHLDLQYAEASRDSRRNALDLYLPGGVTHRPLVVFVHGGAWTVGNKDQHAFVGRFLAQNGYAAAVINYRLHPFVHWPVFAEDCAAACAWLAAHAAEHDLDLERVFLAGHSAGGEIAGVVAFDRRWLRAAGAPDLRIRGFIGLSGAYEVRTPLPQLVQIFGKDLADRAAASPTALAGPDAPPTLLCWASHDMLKLDACGRFLAARLRAAGVPTWTKEIDGNHVSYVFALENPKADLAAPILQFLRERCADADPHGKAKDGAPAVDERREIATLDAGTKGERQVPFTLVLPRGDAPRPLLVVACDPAQGEHTLALARACAAQGTATVVVPCADAGPPETATRGLAAVCGWLVQHRAEVHHGGKSTLAGCGRAVVAALAIGTDPHWLADLGVDHAVLAGILAVGPPALAGDELVRLRDAADGRNPPVVVVHAEDDHGAARALIDALAGRVADLTSLPLRSLELERPLAREQAAADELTGVLVGFAGQ